MLNYHYFLQVSSAYLLFHFAHLGMVWIQPIAPFSHHRHVKFDYYIHDGSSSPNSETLGEIITPIYMHLLSALKQKGLHYQIPHRKPKSLCLNMAIIWSSNIHSEILNMTMVQVGNEGCYFHKRQFSRETNFLLWTSQQSGHTMVANWQDKYNQKSLLPNIQDIDLIWSVDSSPHNPFIQ